MKPASETALEPLDVQRPQVNPDADAPTASQEPWQREPIHLDRPVERPQVTPEAVSGIPVSDTENEPAHEAPLETTPALSQATSQEAGEDGAQPVVHPLAPVTPPPLPVAVYPAGHPWAGYPVLPDGQSPFAVATIPPGPPPIAERTFWNDAILDSAIIVALILGFTFLTMLGVAVSLFASGNFNARSFDLNAMPAPLLWLLNFLMFGTQVVILGVAAWRLSRNKRAGRPNPKLFEGSWLWGVVWGIPAGLAAQLGAVVYSNIVQNVFGTQIDSEQVQMIQAIARNTPALVVLAFMVTIMAPIGEELFFRGAVFGSARASGFASTGATLSALLFAVAHLNFVLAPYYAVVALLLCWLFSKTRTLVAPMAAHFALNASAVIATVLTMDNNMV